MGFFKKVFRPVRKIAKKIIPKEIRPFLPYAAAMIPGAQGLASLNQFMTPVFQKALLAGATSAATDEDGNPLRAAALAAAPDVLSKGLGSAGRILGDANPESKFAQYLVSKGTGLEATLNNPGVMDMAKIGGAQTALDQSAKFAEIRQDEIDAYNRNLLEQGVASKVDRRKAIFGIYKNAGYEEDYINTLLDTYGYAGGGITTLKRGLVDQAGSYAGFDDENYLKNVSRGYKGAKASMKNFFSKDKEDEEEREPVITKNKKGQFVFNFPEKEDKNNLAGHLATAMDGVQKAYGRSFGEMEPVPMMRFARGGEVEIEEEGIMSKIVDSMGDDYDYFTRIKLRENLKQGETNEDAIDLAEQEAIGMVKEKYGFARGGEVEVEEQTEDLGIRDFMRDQGVEYGEQASYGFDDAMGETFEMFQDYRKKGIIPMEMEFDEFLELLQGRKEQGIQGTQVASGYKDDIEEMYEQYVFEMEEQGLQPMDFASYLRQARSGMAKGGRVNYAGGGASYNSSGRYSFLIDKYNKGIPLSPSEADELEMLEMTYADQSRNLDMAEGGIMNKNLLNTGMDKDMRGGGFIPEGTKEKADDVPARLSKNEFVMTADAVRAAGGGSVNQGAKRMYETMHKLEAKV